MSVWRLILKEIAYRKLSFVLGVLSVLVATGVLVGALTILRAHDAETERIVEAKERETRDRMARKEKETAQRVAKLKDDIRRIMKKFGFNLLITPEGQKLDDPYAPDYATRYMPEDYAQQLANSRIMTVRHLLPSLRQAIEWPEHDDRVVILIGIRGEVPLMHRTRKEPIMHPVPPGGMVVGYRVAKDLDLEPGDEVSLLGETFEVVKCRPRTTAEDADTVWIDLEKAQKLLGKEDQINEILALKCRCVEATVGTVRRQIREILPGTDVEPFESRLLVRAEARDAAAEAARKELTAAKQAAREAIQAEVAARGELRQKKQAFAAVLVPLVVLGAIVWVGFLAFGNARERSDEVGILRALGVRAAAVFALFLGKAVAIGLAGAVLGYGAGLLAAALAAGEGAADAARFDPQLFVGVLVAAPVLAGLASWLPAMMAAQQDPALVLREG
ncbi:MAG: ABC transporter permease [Candidatus Brocadiia bacterium]